MIQQYLFNPFRKIAGSKAFIVGWCIMVATIGIAYFSHCHFDGALDAHVGKQSPVYVYLIETIIAWSVMTVVLFVTGKILSQSATRFVDMAGTVALARYPYFFVALISFGVPDLDPEFVRDSLPNNSPQMILLVIISILILLFIIWFIALLYHAFTVSANVKSKRAVWGFIAGVVVAEVISLLIFSYLYAHYI